MRASGRTFRQILQALIDASNGKKIVYVDAIESASEYSFDIALLCTRMLRDVEVKRYPKSITFPNGGRVKFIARGSLCMEAVRGTESILVLDHFTTECEN